MGDARDILEALPDASLGRVMILFPDPWPKTRHAKRRFIQMETLDALARVMTPGAELRFASDDPIYRGLGAGAALRASRISLDRKARAGLAHTPGRLAADAL